MDRSPPLRGSGSGPWPGDMVHLPALIAQTFGTSRSEARRVLDQGGVALDGRQVLDVDLPASSVDRKELRIGRRRRAVITLDRNQKGRSTALEPDVAMPLTVAYSQVRRAMLEVGRDENVKPETLRVVLAVMEAGGSTTTDVLERAMSSPSGTQVRRGLIEARNHGWLVGGNVRGQRAPIDLTRTGQHVGERLVAATTTNQTLCRGEETP